MSVEQSGMEAGRLLVSCLRRCETGVRLVVMNYGAVGRRVERLGLGLFPRSAGGRSKLGKACMHIGALSSAVLFFASELFF